MGLGMFSMDFLFLSKDTNIVNFGVSCEQLQVNDDVVAILAAILDFTIM